jgi:6-phosphofructokinase 1
MGHQAGWLTLGSGIASGADVVLIPEIPYDIDSVVRAIRRRTRQGTNFSIVAIAEGARDRAGARDYHALIARRVEARGEAEKRDVDAAIAAFDADHTGHALRFARQLEALTGLESRVTILGYVQRGGTPSPVDRLLAARLGNAAAGMAAAGTFGVMVAADGEHVRAVPLADVAGRRKTVPIDHPWIETARHLGTCLGD